LIEYTASFLADGATVYTKTLPHTDSAQMDGSEITAIPFEYNGGGYRPLSPENLTTADYTSSWLSGQSVELRWDYKTGNDQSGAGVIESDVPAFLEMPEGYFRLEFYDGSTLVRTEDVTGGASTYTYTNANLVADFGGEPNDFDVKVFNILNGLTSEEEVATIDKM